MNQFNTCLPSIGYLKVYKCFPWCKVTASEKVNATRPANNLSTNVINLPGQLAINLLIQVKKGILSSDHDTIAIIFVLRISMAINTVYTENLCVRHAPRGLTIFSCRVGFRGWEAWRFGSFSPPVWRSGNTCRNVYSVLSVALLVFLVGSSQHIRL